MGNPVALASNLHQCFDTATHVTVLHIMIQSVMRSVPFAGIFPQDFPEWQRLK